MALVNNTFNALGSNNFGVKVPVLLNPQNRCPALQTQRIMRNNMGAVNNTVIPASALMAPFVVSPTGPNVTYVLPTAASILNEFGRSIDTGLAKMASGDSLLLRVVNRGTSPAYLLSNPVGGDGTSVIVYQNNLTGGNAPASTGAVAAVGRLTDVVLEFTAVSSSTNGSTGSYTLYQ